MGSLRHEYSECDRSIRTCRFVERDALELDTMNSARNPKIDRQGSEHKMSTVFSEITSQLNCHLDLDSCVEQVLPRRRNETY